MTGNVALDVVIGLVFVYLLYSLYATIIMELTSSLFGLRAKNLRYTLKRMLGDEKSYNLLVVKWLASIASTFIRILGFAAKLKNRKLYEDFMDRPNIKFLGSGGFGGRPSYLSAENFSKALTDCIKTDDPELPLMASIEIGLHRTLVEGSETKKHIESLIRDANHDPVKFRILLENWFIDTMERSSGWFKQTTQIIVLLIGMVLTISFNVDSIAIIKKLSTDEDARDQMVKLATEFSNRTKGTDSVYNAKRDSMSDEELKKIKQSLEQEIANSRSVLQSSWFLPDSVVYYKLDPKNAPQQDTGKVQQDSIHKDSVKVFMALGHSPKCADTTSTGFIIVHKMVNTDIIRCQFIRKYAGEQVNNGQWLQTRPFWYKIRYVFTGGHLWGYLLTILALSLGAPFWFDLLNKLVKLRTGKQAAETADSNAAAGNTAAMNKDIINRVG